MSHLRSRHVRPPSLKAADFDHEIRLVDDTGPAEAQSPAPSERAVSPGVFSNTPSKYDSDAPLRNDPSRSAVPEERDTVNHGAGHDTDDAQAEHDGSFHNARSNVQSPENVRMQERGRIKARAGKKEEKLETATDILYENERGGILLGCFPLFSGKALGNKDPSPWTNSAQKTSITDTTNTQVPDPTWEWLWPEWRIHHTEEADEEGWEYSFMFSKRFSWHGPRWWNSFVRRRPWIRQRIKKKDCRHAEDDNHEMNSDYFTLNLGTKRSRSARSGATGDLVNRFSVGNFSKREMEGMVEELAQEDIYDIPHLMLALKAALLDRHKIEAVDNFLKNGGDELYYIRDRMGGIMGQFMFQESRRLLLAHLVSSLNEATEEHAKEIENEKDPDPAKQRRLENLEVALKLADQEVKRLEFWSDMKEMAEAGETKGAVDEEQGWGKKWSGLDNSGPKNVLSNPLEGNSTTNDSASDLGKGKETATG